MSEQTMSPAAAAAAVETVEAPSLLDQIMTETRLRPSDDGYDVAKRGVELLIAELIQGNRSEERIDGAVIDRMVAEIDLKMSAQLDEILHDEQLQSLESSWRGLKFLVDRTDFRQNIKLEIINVSKADLLTDFEDSPDVTKSGLYKHIYVDEFGQFGGQPVGSIIGNYEFGPGAADIKLLGYAASVASMAHAPFLTSAGAEMFGISDMSELPSLKDLKSLFEQPKYARWQSFRESEDSRYVGLTAPSFMLRAPYSRESYPSKLFNYEEKAGNATSNYLWGNSAFALATRLTDSFAKYRWTPNIIGPQSGGSVDDLPVHTYEAMGQIETKAATEVMVSDRREYELAEEGFIALTMRKGSNSATFFSANSAQKPKSFGNSEEGKAAEQNYRLGTQLPYMMVINRLAHYIKVLQRENIGSWKTRNELESELTKWINTYVADQENPSADVRSRRPLRKAKVSVEEVEGEAGWYRVGLSVQPHFKYMGADFTLSLTGKLDKA
jgi:type VI secretion system protein ImpC